MLLEPSITREALFDAGRREDVSVEINLPIAEALGAYQAEFEDYLRRAGASVLSPYPSTKIEFVVSRMFGDATPQKTQVGRGLGLTDEMRLREIADTAASYLRDFDPDAFVTASITTIPPAPRVRTGRDRSQYRWWRSDG